jgi:hypothetical protein
MMLRVVMQKRNGQLKFRHATLPDSELSGASTVSSNIGTPSADSSSHGLNGQWKNAADSKYGSPFSAHPKHEPMKIWHSVSDFDRADFTYHPMSWDHRTDVTIRSEFAGLLLRMGCRVKLDTQSPWSPTLPAVLYKAPKTWVVQRQHQTEHDMMMAKIMKSPFLLAAANEYNSTGLCSVCEKWKSIGMLCSSCHKKKFGTDTFKRERSTHDPFVRASFRTAKSNTLVNRSKPSFWQNKSGKKPHRVMPTPKRIKITPACFIPSSTMTHQTNSAKRARDDSQDATESILTKRGKYMTTSHFGINIPVKKNDTSNNSENATSRDKPRVHTKEEMKPMLSSPFKTKATKDNASGTTTAMKPLLHAGKFMPVAENGERIFIDASGSASFMAGKDTKLGSAAPEGRRWVEVPNDAGTSVFFTGGNRAAFGHQLSKCKFISNAATTGNLYAEFDDVLIEAPNSKEVRTNKQPAEEKGLPCVTPGPGSARKGSLFALATPAKSGKTDKDGIPTTDKPSSTRANPAQTPPVHLTPTQKADLDMASVQAHMNRMTLECNPPNQTDPRAMFFSPEQAKLRIDEDRLKNALLERNWAIAAKHREQGTNMTSEEMDAVCIRHLAFCRLYPADCISLGVEEYDRLNRRAQVLADAGEVDYSRLAAEHFMFRKGWRPY